MKHDLNFKLAMAGYFKIEAIKRDGTRRVVADWFPNIILNSGLNRMGTNTTVLGAMVGTGTSTPTATQTALDAQIAYTTTNVVAATFAADTTNNYVSRFETFRFAEGVAAGNLAEIGVGWSSGNCFSRARILDGGGAPTTITVLSDETLDVTYELRIYPMTADVTGSMTLNAISYSYVLRTAQLSLSPSAFFSFVSSASGVGNVSSMTLNSEARTGAGALGDIYSAAGGSGSVDAGSVTAVAYTNNSLQRTIRYIWGLTNGTTPFYNIDFRTAIGCFKASFSPQIPKSGSNILTLDITVTWARRP